MAMWTASRATNATGSTAACRMKNRESVRSLYVSPASSMFFRKPPTSGTVSVMFAPTVAPQ